MRHKAQRSPVWTPDLARDLITVKGIMTCWTPPAPEPQPPVPTARHTRLSRAHHDPRHIHRNATVTPRYVNNLNAALDKYPELQSKTLEELLRGLDEIWQSPSGIPR